MALTSFGQETATKEDTPSPLSSGVVQKRRKVDHTTFRNSFFYQIYFKNNVNDLIRQNYPPKSTLAVVSNISSEEEDVYLTVNAKMEIAWKLVEDLFVGEWEKRSEENVKYSVQFTGDVVLFEESGDLCVYHLVHSLGEFLAPPLLKII